MISVWCNMHRVVKCAILPAVCTTNTCCEIVALGFFGVCVERCIGRWWWLPDCNCLGFVQDIKWALNKCHFLVLILIKWKLHSRFSFNIDKRTGALTSTTNGVRASMQIEKSGQFVEIVYEIKGKKMNLTKFLAIHERFLRWPLST